jgi:DNA-binding beta-propeller fold protein YncE
MIALPDMKHPRISIALCLVTAGIALTAAAGGYHVTGKFKVGGEGGWDYLTADSAARRLYVSHAAQVEVLDLDSGEVVGKIADTPGVHGIAIAPESGRGFVSCGRTANVKIFDLKTLKPVGEAATGKNPDAIIYDPVSRRVFAFNGGSASATAIDAADGKVAGTIELGGRPEFATADGAGHVFVNVEDKSEVVRVDSKNLTAGSHWPLAPCEEPSGMAIDARHHRLFIGCSNKMMAVMDSENGHVVTTLPIGDGVDANGFDPGTGLAFSSNGDGTLTVVHEDSPDKFSVLENAKTVRGARTMALDTKTHHVLLSTAEYGPAPAPTADRPRPRPPVLPGSFAILVMGQ